jgi:hypothetical protein
VSISGITPAVPGVDGGGAVAPASAVFDGGKIAIPGIPAGLGTALYDFVARCKAEDSLQETVGALVAVPDSWTAEDGWISTIKFVPLLNTSGVDSSVGAFAVDREELAAVLTVAVEKRMLIAQSVCSRMGWGDGSDGSSVLWPVVAETVAAAHWRNDTLSDDVSVRDAVYDVGLQSYVDMHVEEQEGWLAGEFDGNGWTKLTAVEYLVATGVSVLCGLAHSHPSGSVELSPQDFLGSQAVDAWRKAFEVRFTGKGQKRDSALETRLTTGSWIFAFQWLKWINALNDSERAALFGGGGSVLSGAACRGALVRYDGRGVRGQWTGVY